jgi:hypothetical protein
VAEQEKAGREHQELDKDEEHDSQPDHGNYEYLAWKGLTYGAMANRVLERANLCRSRAARHSVSASAWYRWATPLAWLTAVLAAVSGVTVVADYNVAAVILSLATAVVAGTNAALKPAETAQKHRDAENDYERMALDLDDFAYFETEANDKLVPLDRRKELREQIRAFDDGIRAIEQRS